MQVLRPYSLAIAFVAILSACGGDAAESTVEAPQPTVAAIPTSPSSSAPSPPAPSPTAPSPTVVSEISLIPSEELAAWGTDTRTLAFASPNGLAIDTDGFIYTTEFQGNRIRKFSPNGELILEWGTSGSGQHTSPNSHGRTEHRRVLGG